MPTINPGDILLIDMGAGDILKIDMGTGYTDQYILINLEENSYYNINYSEVVTVSISTLQTIYARKRLNIVT